MKIKWRTWFKGSPPRPIRLQVPGWSGSPGYSDGCVPQPWHCKPFVDASTYGLELIYPFAHECFVRTSEQEVVTFEGDWNEHEKSTGMMPPFMSFAPHHYGFTSSLDIMTPPGVITRIEPHPAFYTDRTGTFPVPAAGHIETEWWSRIFFIAFKSPLPGNHHVFRPGQPYAQLLFLPRDSGYETIPMTPEEAEIRMARDDILAKYAPKLCSRHYTDHADRRFDNKYKVMSKINEREGTAGVDNYIAGKLDTPAARLRKIAGYRLKNSRETR